jgi:hypothetical protein
VAQVPITTALHGGPTEIRHQRLGCLPSEPLEVTFFVDATLELPVLTAFPADGSDSRMLVLSAVSDTHVLSSEALEIGPLTVPGAAVTLCTDGCAPVLLKALPRARGRTAGGHRSSARDAVSGGPRREVSCTMHPHLGRVANC